MRGLKIRMMNDDQCFLKVNLLFLLAIEFYLILNEAFVKLSNPKSLVNL